LIAKQADIHARCSTERFRLILLKNACLIGALGAGSILLTGSGHRLWRRTDVGLARGSQDRPPLSRSSTRPTGKGTARYRALKDVCRACPSKAKCSPNAEARKITRDIHCPAVHAARKTKFSSPPPPRTSGNCPNFAKPPSCAKQPFAARAESRAVGPPRIVMLEACLWHDAAPSLQRGADYKWHACGVTARRLG